MARLRVWGSGFDTTCACRKLLGSSCIQSNVSPLRDVGVAAAFVLAVRATQAQVAPCRNSLSAGCARNTGTGCAVSQQP
eukprot:365994-Chlamydomonas_euryale.AAC.23